MLLHRTTNGNLVKHEGKWFLISDEPWQDLINRDDLAAVLRASLKRGTAIAAPDQLLAPVGTQQEVWAAGVTYYRSRTARMEEAEQAGGSDFYDRVYHADRPELFMKATPHRVVAHGQTMHLRRDSKWIVPEPELTLVVNRHGRIVGYTIGNDLSCRDIEGENPLYLPQAKTFRDCAAIGPAVLVSHEPLPTETAVQIAVLRRGANVFEGRAEIGQMKKKPQTLVECLYRENTFPQGCLLMTGTGVVPPNDFSLQVGDVVRISIDGIGTLENTMA